jgi:DNA-binding FrmR family transcriptional regulator
MDKKIHNQLRRIEGQIRGIEGMVASGKPTREVLVQLEAAQSSISSVISQLLAGLFEINEDGGLNISQDDAQTILKQIKK